MGRPKEKAPEVETINVDFVVERSTKNTVVFSEVVADGEFEVVGKLYVKKPFVARLGNPSTITVEITTQA